jgi:hypothetical protein
VHQSDSQILREAGAATEPTRAEARTEEVVPDAPARGNLYALEIVFLGVIGLATVVAFAEALSYKLVSSRTPFVIMVPLFVLIAVHARRLWRVRHEFHPGTRLRIALSGGNAHLNKVVGFSGWMIGLVAMITAFGQYVGIFAFCVILMHFVARERWILTLAVAGATTFFIYGTFEYLFNIDLYRGLLFRWYLGYRDF